MKDIIAEMINFPDRKEKAAMITELVKQNSTFIPSLHIDVIKDIHISRRKTYDNSQALLLQFSNPSVANEVMAFGLQWQKKKTTPVKSSTTKFSTGVDVVRRTVITPTCALAFFDADGVLRGTSRNCVRHR